MQCIFLLLNTMIYFIAAPFEISLIECIVPLIKACLLYTSEKLLETCPLYRDMWQAHIGAKDQM